MSRWWARQLWWLWRPRRDAGKPTYREMGYQFALRLVVELAALLMVLIKRPWNAVATVIVVVFLAVALLHSVIMMAAAVWMGRRGAPLSL